MRRVDNDTVMPGQDSFLDVVANIVGILILLVMVVGLRALREPQQQPSADVAVDETSKEDVESAYRYAVATQAEVRDLIIRTVNVHQEALLREQERTQLNTFVAAVAEEIDNRRSKLDVEQQRDFDLRRQLADAQLTLDDLGREQFALLSQAPEIEEIENLPTPLAQTVTGKEVHLRLAGGHVAFIPIDELLGEFKQDIQENVWRLSEQDEIVQTVGPVQGFRLRYRLRKGHFVVRHDSGMEQHGSMAQFMEWKLLPVAAQFGEPVEQALLPNSDLLHSLKDYPPERTTVTIWTYPGSFDEFRLLRRALFDLGYATAGRPLPKGVLIGGSPYGSKSAAQ